VQIMSTKGCPPRAGAGRRDLSSPRIGWGIGLVPHQLKRYRRTPVAQEAESPSTRGVRHQVNDGVNLSHTKAEIQEKILGFIRSEIADKTTPVALDTPIDAANIDSIDVIHVIFKVEEEFKTEVSLSNDVSYATVGEFVDALIRFIPPDQMNA
jgi:acyl carrier protein